MDKKVMIGLGALLVVATSISGYSYLRPSETDIKFNMCKEEVLSRSRAPSTVNFSEYKFSPLSNYNATYQAERFEYYIDAENAFGGKIRKNLICYLRYKDGELVDVSSIEND